MRNLTLKDLSIDHDYYCSSSNFHDNEFVGHWSTWKEFYDQFKGADTDMNLVYRWDIFFNEEENTYRMLLVHIAQRKGIYIPQNIDIVTEEDVEEIISYLKNSWEKLQSIWSPLSDHYSMTFKK